MPFPHKTATEIEYLRELANIASTLAACKSHECQAAAELIGQEVQALISPPAQEGPKHAGDEQPGAWTYTQSSPAMPIGEIGSPVRPIDAAIERVKEARIELNKFPSDGFSADGYTEAASRYNEAVDTLECEIDRSVRGNPEIGTPVDPVAAAVEDLSRARAVRDVATAELNAAQDVSGLLRNAWIKAQEDVRAAVMRLEDATQEAVRK